MIVSFYPFSGNICNSTNVLINGLIFAFNHKKVLIINTRYNDLAIEKMIFGDELNDIINYNIGFSSIMKLVKNEVLSNDDIENYVLSVFKNSNLDLLTFTSEYDYDIKDYKIVLNKLKNIYDLILVDLVYPCNINAFEFSDLIVYNIVQNKNLIEKFLKNESVNFDKNILINLSNYSYLSNTTAFNIKMRYKLKKVLKTPYNSELIDVINKSKIVDYIMSNLKLRKRTTYFKDMLELNKNILKSL